MKKSEDSWLAGTLTGKYVSPRVPPLGQKIEQLANETNEAGPQPLWNGYAQHNRGGDTRMPDDVRTRPVVGNLFASLVQSYKPSVVVEIGTAFGVSGMYFLAGLEANRAGHLYTFEPNGTWRGLAVSCLEQVSDRFTSVHGTFEGEVDTVLGRDPNIDMAFIDGIHASEFVISQLNLVIERCQDKAIIILDDICFSDDMQDCWRDIGQQDRFISSVAIGRRVGVVEFAR